MGYQLNAAWPIIPWSLSIISQIPPDDDNGAGDANLGYTPFMLSYVQFEFKASHACTS